MLAILATSFLEPICRAQQPSNSVADAMLAMVRQVAIHPTDDGHIRRTMALVIKSAQRLDELERINPRQAAAFRTAFVGQLRMIRATLSLLGSNSLVSVREEMVGNLERSAGQQEPASVRFLSVVAGREGQTGSDAEIRKIVSAVVEALKKSAENEGKRSEVERLIIEASAVIEMMGPDGMALVDIRSDLSSLTN